MNLFQGITRLLPFFSELTCERELSRFPRRMTSNVDDLLLKILVGVIIACQGVHVAHQNIHVLHQGIEDVHWFQSSRCVEICHGEGSTMNERMFARQTDVKERAFFARRIFNRMSTCHRIAQIGISSETEDVMIERERSAHKRDQLEVSGLSFATRKPRGRRRSTARRPSKRSLR